MNTVFLAKSPLFQGIHPDQIEQVLSCLHARWREFEKGEIIFPAGTCIQEIGLLESGCANMVVSFYWGQDRIFGHFEAGEVIGENYAAAGDIELPGDMVAGEKTRILFLDLQRILTTCSRCCGYHHQLMLNLFQIAARRNLSLFGRMMDISSRSIRDRLISYLSQQALKARSRSFQIPFDRQQLADYLGVDRSALSAQLSRMKQEGLLDYHKNRFTLLDKPDQRD